jgi:hypothetical protein
MAAMAFELPDIWTLAGLILALVGIGASMISVPGPGRWEFRISGICFVGAALLFLGKLAIWGAEDLTLTRVGLVGILGAAIAVALAYSIQWVGKKEEAASASRPAVIDRVPIIDLPKGSLKYVNMIAHVVHIRRTNETSVQMQVELSNPTRYLIRFHARLNGSVMGKASPNGMIEFDGVIQPEDTSKFLYDTIYDVQVNAKPDPKNPAIFGLLNYDVVYWVDGNNDERRRTSKTCEFNSWFIFSPGKGYTDDKIPITIRLSNQIEE